MAMHRVNHALRCLLILITIQGAAQDEIPFKISVDLNLVVLPVSVRDRHDNTVSGLKAENFEVYEDGVRQNLRIFRAEDIPVTAGLVVDHSGSMQRKIEDVTAAAQAFARSGNPGDQMFVINFNGYVSPGLPEGMPFSNRADELGQAILRAPVTGNTALYDAIDVALDRLQTGNRDRKALLVISDGGDNASVSGLQQVLTKAGQSGAVIYTVGIFDPNDYEKNPAVLRKIAKATGGEAYFPAQHSDTVAICERIAADIRSQYTLGYVSSNATKSGAWRNIRVVAHSGRTKFTVRARPGYAPGGEGTR